jgi:hypothetical protein
MKRILLLIALFLLVSPQVFLSVSAQDKKEKSAVVETPQPELNVTNNVLYIKNAPIGSRLEIITIVGNKVQEIVIKSTDSSYVLTLPKAIYIFKIEGVVRKFVIR